MCSHPIVVLSRCKAWPQLSSRLRPPEKIRRPRRHWSDEVPEASTRGLLTVSKSEVTASERIGYQSCHPRFLFLLYAEARWFPSISYAARRILES
jgi:hypothetical protein